MVKHSHLDDVSVYHRHPNPHPLQGTATHPPVAHMSTEVVTHHTLTSLVFYNDSSLQNSEVMDGHICTYAQAYNNLNHGDKIIE